LGCTRISSDPLNYGLTEQLQYHAPATSTCPPPFLAHPSLVGGLQPCQQSFTVSIALPGPIRARRRSVHCRILTFLACLSPGFESGCSVLFPYLSKRPSYPPSSLSQFCTYSLICVPIVDCFTYVGRSQIFLYIAHYYTNSYHYLKRIGARRYLMK